MKSNNFFELLNEHKVVIPPIQRDYAQGRKTGNIPYIRNRFLDDIVNVIQNEHLNPMKLDFIYGYEEIDSSNSKEISVFKPLDGQQRLTTLFLIYWFIAVKENRIETAEKFLLNFSYATRKSSRDFCEKLIHFKPSFNEKSIRIEIINQSWFFSTWSSDPTISSMLVMLEEIELKFKPLANTWEKLTGSNTRITFHLLSMDDLGLPDDLYIKMNARGKGLTDFEHFKSQFSDLLDEEAKNIFNSKIDQEWSDLFWNIFKNQESEDVAKEVDNGFLSFFWYITDLLINKNKIKIKNDFWLDKIREVYSQSPDNVKFLFGSLELFQELEKSEKEYFDDIFYIDLQDFHPTKTRIFFTNPKVNLFRKCAETYGFDKKKNNFSVGEQLLLYAFIYMKLNKKEVDNKKFRLLRNIFAQSEDQMRNEYLASFLYDDVETLINKKEYANNSKLSRRQLEEEKEKDAFLKNHPELETTLFQLEDHRLLRGNIALFELDQNINKYANQFQGTFKTNCDYFLISRAMLTFGNYTQFYGRNGKNRRFGNRNSSTWREIFTQSENRKGFKNTKIVLKNYLEVFIKNSAITNENIIAEYLQEFDADPQLPKDIRYYYVKYKNFRFWNDDATQGFYYWDDYNKKPYENWMLFRRQFNGRHWNPFLLTIDSQNDKCSLENYGDKLQFTSNEIILLIQNINNGFHFTTVADDLVSKGFLQKIIETKTLDVNGVLKIAQDEQGFDLEDRIFKCDNFLNELLINEKIQVASL